MRPTATAIAITAARMVTTSPLPPGAVPIDWNRDFKLDYAVAGRNGVHIFAQQDDGIYKDATPKAEPLIADTFGVWAADVEMDGDLDLVAGVRGRPPVVLRNNGDGSWKQLAPFAGVTGVRA